MKAKDLVIKMRIKKAFRLRKAVSIVIYGGSRISAHSLWGTTTGTTHGVVCSRKDMDGVVDHYAAKLLIDFMHHQMKFYFLILIKLAKAG